MSTIPACLVPRFNEYTRKGNIVKNAKLFAAICLLQLSLASSYCLAALLSPCEPIKDYVNKTRNDISIILPSLNDHQINDLVDQANNCKDAPDVAYSAAHITLDGRAIDKSEINKTAQKILDVAAAVATEKTKVAKEKEALDNSLKAFNFAVGIGTIILDKNDIRTASIDQGVVRTTDEEKNKIGIWLSTNTYFKVTNNSRYGLFLSTQVGGGGSNSDLLNSFAIGLSWTSSKRSTTPTGLGNAPLVFQIGYGITRIQRYAAGYGDGQPLPTGTNQPLMKKTTETGPVLLVSYSLE